MGTLSQDQFKRDLEQFIIRVAEMPRFAGQTYAIKALRRLSKAAALK